MYSFRLLRAKPPWPAIPAPLGVPGFPVAVSPGAAWIAAGPLLQSRLQTPQAEVGSLQWSTLQPLGRTQTCRQTSGRSPFG